MWLILTPCFLSQVIPITAFTAPVSWDVSPKQVEFGKNVTLTCTVHTTSILQDRHIPQWGVKGLTEFICHKDCSPETDKYSPTIQYHASTFALVIHNFSETDLNVKYWCSYGLHKMTTNLTTDLISILKMPAQNSIIDNTAVDFKGRLHINITVAEVYPVPLCSVNITKLKGQIISEVTLNATVFDINKFQKKVEVVGVVDCGLEKYERHIKIDCCINSTLKNLLKRNFTLCQELHAIESSAPFEVVTIVVASVLTLLSLVLLISLVIHYRNRFRGYFAVKNTNNKKTVNYVFQKE
ncbi:uncharacterized protein LOC134681238 isoform X1 [Mytilus trossulus]|uniref:uncharacterized protein LOC134681238 isoform X1 n=1 Tax=Mytilus trossulus TaxID=6551 RepID=UPI0030046BCE